MCSCSIDPHAQVFDGLLEETRQGSEHLDTLRERLTNATKALARVDQVLGTADVAEVSGVRLRPSGPSSLA